MRHIRRHEVRLAEHARDRVGERLVDRPFAVADHVHVDDHDAAVVEMLMHEREELLRAHLERDCDVLIRVDHDHVEPLVARRKPCAPVVGGHADVSRLVEIRVRQLGDLAVDLDARHCRPRRILAQGARICASAHAQDQRGVGMLGDRGRGERDVVIHAGGFVALHRHRLHTEEHVRGEDRTVGHILHLQVVVHRFTLIRERALVHPEREAGERRAHRGRCEHDHTDRARHAVHVC